MTNPTLLRREDAPLESIWNREAVFESWAAWETEYEQAQSELPALRAFAGRLGEGPTVLLDWLQAHSTHWRRMMKLWLFARMAVWVDTTDLAAKAHFSQATALQGKIEAETAFAELELMQLGETTLTWADEEPQLTVYQHYFANLLRQQAHQRSAEVEEILGLLADPFSGAAATHRELTNTDLRIADAIDSQGQRHPVRPAPPVARGLQSPDREQRRTAWQNFADGHLALQNSLASNYLTLVKQQVFLAKVRGYSSVLEMRLAPSNLPVSVFHNVINTFKAQLPVWHRYWVAKRKALGLETLHPYDIFAPLAETVPQVPYRQAVTWICEAMQPLGEAYVDTMRRGCLEERWVDYAPTSGKMSGAACTPSIVGIIPPFIYMSYDESLMSASVLAHELGHSMHFQLNTHQPHVYNNFRIMSFAVVEIPSNFQQAMLRAYLQSTKPDDRLFSLALIDEAMFNFHRYFFLMPTLARFEFEVYSRAEAGQSLTVKDLNQIMAELFAEGYGHTLVDDPARTAITWAQFTHLYIPFYTFQYTVGLSAAQAVAARVLSGSEQAVADYLAFLRVGASRYPLDLFRLAGVDMTSPEPVEQAFEALAGLVDRLEELAN